MSPFDQVDADVVISGRSDWIDAEGAAALARYPLECVDTAFPHYWHAVEGADEPIRPTERHPVFYGCFDWHSAVHGHWCLCRLLRLFPDHPDREALLASLESRFTAEKVAGEVAHFEANPSFEKPYGWGWFLRLVAELRLWESDRAEAWIHVLSPLEDRIVELVESEFLPQERPFRVGTHHNAAFALQCVLDYARVTGNESLESVTSETARRFFADDRDYPVEYEPLGWDFLSPALAEADLVRRLLEPAAFSTWFEGFLPDLLDPPSNAVLDPVAVEAGSDGGIERHLVGLNLSRAWALAGIAAALEGHRYAPAIERSAARHAERGLERAFTDDYAGAHWLSSFVLYLVTRAEGGIAPE